MTVKQEEFLFDVYDWLNDDMNEGIIDLHSEWKKTLGHDAFIAECERFLTQRYMQMNDWKEPESMFVHECALEYAKGF